MLRCFQINTYEKDRNCDYEKKPIRIPHTYFFMMISFPALSCNRKNYNIFFNSCQYPHYTKQNRSHATPVLLLNHYVLLTVIRTFDLNFKSRTLSHTLYHENFIFGCHKRHLSFLVNGDFTENFSFRVGNYNATVAIFDL